MNQEQLNEMYAMGKAQAEELTETGAFNPLTWRPGDPIPEPIAIRVPEGTLNNEAVQAAYQKWTVLEVAELVRFTALGLWKVVLRLNANGDLSEGELVLVCGDVDVELSFGFDEVGRVTVLPNDPAHRVEFPFQVGAHPILWAIQGAIRQVYTKAAAGGQ